MEVRGISLNFSNAFLAQLQKPAVAEKLVRQVPTVMVKGIITTLQAAVRAVYFAVLASVLGTGNERQLAQFLALAHPGTQNELDIREFASYVQMQYQSLRHLVTMEPLTAHTVFMEGLNDPDIRTFVKDLANRHSCAITIDDMA